MVVQGNQGLQDLQDQAEIRVWMDHLATLAARLQACHRNLETLDRQDQRGNQENPVRWGHQEIQDSQEIQVHVDLQDHPDNRVCRERWENQDSQVNQDPLANRVFAPNTAPWMVVSSSKMEHGAKTVRLLSCTDPLLLHHLWNSTKRKGHPLKLSSLFS